MKYIILSLLSSLLLSFAWPTLGFPFFIFIAFVPLLYVENQISKSETKKKFWLMLGLSFFTFIIWNILTTGWLYNSKNPDGSNSFIAVAFPVVANSLLMSFTFQVYHYFKNKRRQGLSLLFFVVVWMSFEKLHLEWEFTWPWLNLGNVFSEYPQFIQWYDTFGATGGSFWILIINATIFSLIDNKIRKVSAKNLLLVLGIIFLPIMVSLFKYYYFSATSFGKLKVMLLQPNLDPYTEKYEKDSLQIVNELLDLARKSNEKIDYYIAPETAFPGSGGLSEKTLKKSQSIQLVGNTIKNINERAIFVGGVSTYNIYDKEEKTSTASFYPKYNLWKDSYNSAIQIYDNRDINIYHKSKLVPGVEIFPYINVLKPILGDVMLDFGGIVTSLGIDDKRKVFSNYYNKGKLAPVICYESIYGEYTTEYVKNGANFLAVMTNDSWWGVSQGHKQLLSYARLRAIETRREIARAANSGISAHIDVKGNILKQTKYGQKDILVADIQLYNQETIYTKIGDIISKISLFFCIILLGIFIFDRIVLK